MDDVDIESFITALDRLICCTVSEPEDLSAIAVVLRARADLVESDPFAHGSK